MRPSFFPRLVNNAFEDPGLFLPFEYQKRAFLCDLGDLQALSTRDLLKISHVFVTHTHMDHFIGFDRLLRVLLGREKQLYLFGPEGFLQHIEGKLAGYTWNLVQQYENQLILEATEVLPDHTLTKHYSCQDRFKSTRPVQEKPFTGQLLAEANLMVSSAVLDHRIACLGFAVQEHRHINIKKDAVDNLGLQVGPWLTAFKRMVAAKADPDTEFEVYFSTPSGIKRRTFLLEQLTEEIAVITPGQKVAYVADLVYSPENRAKVLKLADQSDHLFIEAAFLDRDRQIAGSKYHLTARQAGTLAGEAGAKQFTLFHFSPRYTDQGHLLVQEAQTAYLAAKARCTSAG